MAKFHQIECQFWEEMLGEKPVDKLIYAFLCTNSLVRPTGLYTIKIQTIQAHTGCSEAEFRAICGTLIEYDFETHEVFVRGKLKRVLSKIERNKKMISAIQSDIHNTKSTRLKALFFKKYKTSLKPLVSPLEGATKGTNTNINTNININTNTKEKEVVKKGVITQIVKKKALKKCVLCPKEVTDADWSKHLQDHEDERWKR